MRFLRSALLYAGGLVITLSAMAAPVHLQTEHRTDPLGVDVSSPRFAWQSDATAPNWMQQAYEIEVGTDEQAVRGGKGDVWDSGRIASPESIDIAYRGPALRSHTRYFWTVRVWNNKGKVEESAPAWFETYNTKARECLNGLSPNQEFERRWPHNNPPISFTPCCSSVVFSQYNPALLKL